MMEEPLTELMLAAAQLGDQKRMIGEALLIVVSKGQPERAGEVVDKLLELENSELLTILRSEQILKDRAKETLQLLEQSGGVVGSTADVQVTTEAALDARTSLYVFPASPALETSTSDPNVVG